MIQNNSENATYFVSNASQSKVADGIATVESDLSLSSLLIVRLASDRLSTKRK